MNALTEMNVRIAQLIPLNGMKRAAVRGCALMIVLSVWCKSVAAQIKTTRIPDTVSCKECEIRVQVRATLGDESGSGKLGGLPTGIAEDLQGRFWVIGGGNAPQVFGPSGAFAQTVSVRGTGPMAFGSPLGVTALSGDSIMLVDTRLNALIISPDFAVARSIRLPLVPASIGVVRWPDNVWMSGFVPSRDAAGLSIHRLALSRDATLLGSFGPGDGQLLPNSDRADIEWIAASKDGSVWSGNRMEYRLSEWTDAGELVRSLARSPSWFAKRSPPWLIGRQTPPPPALAAILVDPQGFLWTFVNVPAKTWKEAVARLPAPVPGGGIIDIDLGELDLDKAWSTIVEVIDTKNGRVVARKELPEWVVAPLRGMSVAAIRRDSEGVARVTVLRFELARVP